MKWLVLSEESGPFHELFHRCALAILNCGSDSDDPQAPWKSLTIFEIRIVQEERGVKLQFKKMRQALPLLMGKMINSVREMLFSVLRDIIFTQHEIQLCIAV